jgi:hypothetical protein
MPLSNIKSVKLLELLEDTASNQYIHTLKVNCKLKRKEKRGLLRDFAVVWYRIEPAEKPEAIGRNPQPVRSKWQNTETCCGKIC